MILNSVLKILLLLATIMADIVLITLCGLGVLPIPIFLFGIVMNVGSGIVIGWDF